MPNTDIFTSFFEGLNRGQAMKAAKEREAADLEYRKLQQDALRHTLQQMKLEDRFKELIANRTGQIQAAEADQGKATPDAFTPDLRNVLANLKMSVQGTDPSISNEMATPINPAMVMQKMAPAEISPIQVGGINMPGFQIPRYNQQEVAQQADEKAMREINMGAMKAGANAEATAAVNQPFELQKIREQANIAAAQKQADQLFQAGENQKKIDAQLKAARIRAALTGEGVAASKPNIPDATSQSILQATGLSQPAFAYATQGTSALTRMPAAMRLQYMGEWEKYAKDHGIDTATFGPQYQAIGSTVTANLLRNNQAQVAEDELEATITNLRQAADEATFKNLKWGNVAKMFAGEQVNDPALAKYQVHLEQLRSEFAMYNAALAGQIDANGNIREISADDYKKAENILRDGFAQGSISGFENALRASRDKMRVVLDNSIENQNKMVWKMFGVKKPDVKSTPKDVPNVGGTFNGQKVLKVTRIQ